MRYFSRRKHHRTGIPGRLVLVGIFLVVLAVGASIAVRHVYYQNLKPVSTNQQRQIVTIASGSSVKLIGKQLAEQGVIRKAWAF